MVIIMSMITEKDAFFQNKNLIIRRATCDEAKMYVARVE